MKFFNRKSKKSRFTPLIVSAVERITPNAVAIKLKLPKDRKSHFDFMPGQYVDIEAKINGSSIVRSYSICSLPNGETISLGIKRIENGLFSEYANRKLKKGDLLQVSSPKGRFVMKNTSNNIIFFVSGSGITPVFSIIRSILNESSNRKITLVYGNKSPTETMFYKELETLEHSFPEQLKIHWVFSRASEEGALFGRIDEEKINFVLEGLSPDYCFLCGPQSMIELITRVLEIRGIPKSHICYELFTSDNATKKPHPENSDHSDSLGKSSHITIILEGETHEFQLSKKKSILEGALKNNINAPFSCQGGVCASCLARVISGEVSVKENHVLTEKDIKEKLTITCQAHPSSPKVIINYDKV